MKFIESVLSLIDRRLLPRTRAGATLYCALLGVALLAAGCTHKSAKVTPPVLVPSIESAPEEPAPAPQTATEPQPTPEPESTPASAPSAQKPRPKPRKPARKPATPVVVEAPKTDQGKPEPAQPEPSHPATPDTSVQITAAVPASAMQSQRQNTEQLLRSSKAKLEGVTRQLNDSERAMANQARDYIAQSNQAMQEGEVERAYNLAVKANLLADELAK